MPKVLHKHISGERERVREKRTKSYIVMCRQQNEHIFAKYFNFIITKYILLSVSSHQKYLQENLHNMSPSMRLSRAETWSTEYFVSIRFKYLTNVSAFFFGGGGNIKIYLTHRL